MPEARPDRIAPIAANAAFDVIVVGGGINGIGVFHDLAHQGLRVLLVERNDFCSGCSAAPSRMIHGGLRYLENGEFSLVRESLVERDRLLRNAPHLVRPLPTTIPIDRFASGLANAVWSFLGFTGRPRPRGALPIKLGLMLYDAITGRGRMLPRHRFRGRSATKAAFPQLRPGLRFSATYHDAWISHPERLGVELIGDALARNPTALALNYAHLVHGPQGLVLTDGETGQSLPVSARMIVNATGAWIDESAASLGATQSERLVSGTKGSHLILENPALAKALNGHMIYFEHGDGRVCIVFPYLGRVLAGSTDLRVDTVGRTSCTEAERDYILGAVQGLFPRIPVQPDQIVYSYAGIRPLPVSAADFTGRIPRGHAVRRLAGAVPQIGMVGGKWTTYRAFAEATVDMVLSDLGLPRKASTRDLPIGGGAGFTEGLAAGLAQSHALSPARAAHLEDMYGARAADVADFCADREDCPLPGSEMTEAEVSWATRKELALHLSDVLQRRSPLAIRGLLTLPLITATARIMAAELGWSEVQAKDEIARFLGELETYHGVRLTPTEGAQP
ncbi:MAG: glycerol-3-phosphate dehydrogenase [Alphaproteobacteria bacterium HGW-Alphaproteobacteria-6]|nr:MAG: glycerol-3-phosphate dehydrogenase [Alphaproteobacteria bacterium HGW-Alphaproteobacteria-6]